ncbi:DNA polymerase III subunit psi [Methylophaga sulfidovorans]|uniref:DNA polymerase III psi subunit n=1 Tax=Methylophaga sulfidovorans TaxID=45496 RepID=A0A1I3YXM5_9GAMM|nr:DNA polymerase III subunit psi [Methylophaga sulfidovorans]SFK36585.1 DNA polymerase III psi subunit [Methylophaga sulfidovorans]
MALSEYQYSVLSEMGIPVWTQRQSKTTEIITATESQPLDNLQSNTLQIPNDVQLLIIVETTQLATVEQRLLSSILKAVSLDNRRQFLIESQDLRQVSEDDFHSKTIITMTEAEYSLPEGIECVQLPSLAAMVKQTSLKAIAWQQLKRYRHAFN